MNFNKIVKKEIAELCGKNDRKNLIKYLENMINSIDEKYAFYFKSTKKGTNEYFLMRFYWWLKDGGELPFSVFTVGNMKLPFLNFSTLPAVTCGGAGSCLNWCYSFKAWRYPSAFLRQCQNTLLMFDFNIIETELNKVLQRPKFSKLNKIDFRLYVDGDFNTIQDLKNWMELMRKNPKLNSYGYSKSLNHFFMLHENGYKFPSNYVLNLSTGGIYDSLFQFLEPLPFVRGVFKAVDLKGGTFKGYRKQNKNKKIFVCPLKCGECTSIGHACGNLDVFKNYEIVIAKH